MTRFERVAVIGVGLIGGSFALALKAANACGRVIGAGRDRENLRIALERGAIDRIAADAVEAVHEADLVLVSVPVAQVPAVFATIAAALAPGAVITDAGSTKRDAVAAARRSLGRHVARLVPAHPIAGAEYSGAAAARADLFRGKRVVLSPVEETAPEALARAEAAWETCGARIFRMTPEEHDAVFAAVSHLPHLLAYALVHQIAGRANSAQLLGFAAGGFRDFTRIASSQPEIWRDICLANRDALLAELSSFGNELTTVRALLEAGDGAGLEELFAHARDARRRWLGGEFEP